MNLALFLLICLLVYNFRSFLYILLLIPVLSVIRCSKPVIPIEHVHSRQPTPLDSFMADFSDYFSHQVSICNCPGAALAIVEDTTISLVKGYGLRSVTATDHVDEHTLFRLASVSKGFGAVLTARLVDKGLLHWNDPVNQYIPDFEVNPVEETPKIAVANILSHSLGLPYHSYTNLIEAGKSIAEIIPLFKEVRLNLLPTQKYAYQNASFALIEKVAEKATGGQPFTSLLQQELFRPLRLKDMSFTYEDMINSPNKALPHRADHTGRYHTVEITPKYYNAVSAGGINASASDMAVWLHLLLGHYPEVLSRNALDSIFAPHILTSMDRRHYNFWPGVKETYYGLGWRILDLGDHFRYYHGGYANEYRAEIAIDPEYKIGICGMFNAPCDVADYLVPSFFQHYEQWKCLREN